MKVQIKPGFLFLTKFWTSEINENIENDFYWRICWSEIDLECENILKCILL